MTPKKTKKICIVGAGSSGLTAAKNLVERGFEVDVIEREDDLGGNWNFGKPNARVYASTHTISSRPFTQFPDFPMPDSFPDYPHHTQVLEYFRRYADHFSLRDHVEFNTSVERVERPEDQQGWIVDLRMPDGALEPRHYAALVIANGHNWYPKTPEYPGEFRGEVIHSAMYRDPSILRGKRVLVVGAGNTGCDVAVEAAQHAMKAFHSTRRGYWYAPKYVFGKPSDQLYDLFLGLRLPLPVMRTLLETTTRLTMGDLTRHGLPKPDHKFLETHPIVNSLLVHYLSHGDLAPRRDVERFDGKTVHFVDGTKDEIDLIVYCTGYLIHVPFIDPAHLNWDNGRPKLYKNVFHPDHDDLFFIGLIQPDSGQFKLVHWQSVAVARFLQAQALDGAVAREFRREKSRGIDEDLGAGVHYKESTRHYVEVNHMDYLRGLTKVIERLGDADPRAPAERVMRPLEWALPTSPRRVVLKSPASEPKVQGPPLLFLHFGTEARLEGWVEAAKTRGWLPYALDLSGRSTPRFSPGGARHHVHDTLQAIATLDAPPVLVGHGRAASIAERVLELYPARAGVLLGKVTGRKGKAATLVASSDAHEHIAPVFDWLDHSIR